MQKVIMVLLALIVLASCSSGDDKPGYTSSNFPDVEYVCEDGECGAYPELLKCQDGTLAVDVRCIFVEKYGTCSWVGSNCKLDPEMERCNL